MSKNIVDSIIEYSNKNNIPIGLIPSRRQVEFNGGYVNNWTTSKFCDYVKKRSDKILLVRDHSGPDQGYTSDDGLISFDTDCGYFDGIHIDVWKKHPMYEDGLRETVKFIKRGYLNNPKLFYEIGTEESIRKFTTTDINNLITDLRNQLTFEEFSMIKYCVIQSGTALKENSNIGIYDQERLVEMVNVVKSNNLISKEHNGDYLNEYLLVSKFSNGLDSINIAPEYGQIETSIILEIILQKDKNLYEDFYKICLESNRWLKWVNGDFVPENNKDKIINISGHYVFSDPKFQELKAKIDDGDLDNKIKKFIIKKLDSQISKIKN